MNYYINQNIVIHNFKVSSVSNSSVLQIGSAGMIKALSNLYNTGGYTEPAPEAIQVPLQEETPQGATPAVPLSPPTG